MLSVYIVPGLMSLIVLYGLFKKAPVFDLFIEGAKDGLTTVGKVFPPLIALLVAVGMFKSSGALDMIVHALSPAARLIGLPGEVLPLALMRPVSGSGALAIFKDVTETSGPDSITGRIAAIMMGSSETTFYAIAVYYGSLKINKTRHTLPAALVGDFVGLIGSVIAVKLMF